jgi:predicted kinase
VAVERGFVIVSGPPGAGKSSLAIPLAQRLGLPLLRKDHIKETLHDHLPAHGGARDSRCAPRFSRSVKQPRLARC